MRTWAQNTSRRVYLEFVSLNFEREKVNNSWLILAINRRMHYQIRESTSWLFVVKAGFSKQNQDRQL